jgi:hypothetical protein
MAEGANTAGPGWYLMLKAGERFVHAVSKRGCWSRATSRPLGWGPLCLSQTAPVLQMRAHAPDLGLTGARAGRPGGDRPVRSHFELTASARPWGVFSHTKGDRTSW